MRGGRIAANNAGRFRRLHCGVPISFSDRGEFLPAGRLVHTYPEVRSNGAIKIAGQEFDRVHPKSRRSSLHLIGRQCLISAKVNGRYLER